MNDYKPVNCGCHDKLEAIATLRRTSQITYLTEAGETARTAGKSHRRGKRGLLK